MVILLTLVFLATLVLVEPGRQLQLAFIPLRMLVLLRLPEVSMRFMLRVINTLMETSLLVEQLHMMM